MTGLLYSLPVEPTESPLDRLELDSYLIYFDGPILSHFITYRRTNNWLRLWVDTDGVSDRYLLFEVEEYALNAYKLREQTLLSLMTSPKNGIVFVLDTDKHQIEIKGLSVTTPKNIPIEYLPAQDSYYEFEPIEIFSSVLDREEIYGLIDLDGNWSLNDFKGFTTVYEQLYAFTAMLTQKRLFPIVESYPWRGGYSSIGFFNRILSRVYPPRVSAIEYASPGYLLLEVNEEAAKALEQSLLGYIRNKASLESTYSDIESYIRSEKLNSSFSTPISMELTVEQRKTLSDSLNKLAQSLNIFELLDSNTSESNFIFGRVKALMAYIRKLRELEEFHSAGMAQFHSLNKIFEKELIEKQSVFNSRRTPDEDVPF